MRISHQQAEAAEHNAAQEQRRIDHEFHKAYPDLTTTDPPPTPATKAANPAGKPPRTATAESTGRASGSGAPKPTAVRSPRTAAERPLPAEPGPARKLAPVEQTALKRLVFDNAAQVESALTPGELRALAEVLGDAPTRPNRVVVPRGGRRG